MKRMTLVAVALMGLVGAARAEMVSIVQTTDMRGQTAYDVMNRDEFNALLKEIKDETAVFAAAVADAKKEWESNKDNKIPFQGSRIKPRAAKKMGPDFTDREKADKKKSTFEDRSSDKQIAELDKKTKGPKPKEEDVAKEEARTKAFDTAFEMISKKMGDKLGRPVPAIGFATGDFKKDGVKKEEPKKEAVKKEEPKKDGLKK